MKFEVLITVEQVEVPLLIDIDVNNIAKELGVRAAYSKGAKAVAASGLVKVTCSKKVASVVQLARAMRVRQQYRAGHEAGLHHNSRTRGCPLCYPPTETVS